jgi:AbrB family looped-hinge helix DNA binding protein
VNRRVIVDTAKVSSKYQIVIPKKAREVLGIDEGDKVVFDYRDGMVVLLPKPKDFVEFSRGLGAEVWRDADAALYVEGERGSWQKTNG